MIKIKKYEYITSNDITITVQWSDVSNSIQIDQGIVEFKN